MQTRQRALTLTDLPHLPHLHWHPELREKTDFCSPSVCGIVRHIVGRRYIWRCHWRRGNFSAGLRSPCPSATSNTVVPVPPKVTFSASDTSLSGQSATLENGIEMISSECVEHSKVIVFWGYLIFIMNMSKQMTEPMMTCFGRDSRTISSMTGALHSLDVRKLRSQYITSVNDADFGRCDGAMCPAVLYITRLSWSQQRGQGGGKVTPHMSPYRARTWIPRDLELGHTPWSFIGGLILIWCGGHQV